MNVKILLNAVVWGSSLLFCLFSLHLFLFPVFVCALSISTLLLFLCSYFSAILPSRPSTQNPSIHPYTLPTNPSIHWLKERDPSTFCCVQMCETVIFLWFWVASINQKKNNKPTDPYCATYSFILNYTEPLQLHQSAMLEAVEIILL